MFGNKFDVQSTLDATLFSEAYKIGQLDSYGVGQMAAYQDGMMGSPFEAALADKFSPEMQKQNLLDELQRKHPNPDTPEKLTALASDLFANGLGDMGIKVQEAATQLLAANASMKRMGANNAIIAGKIGSMTSLLTGASSISSKWANYSGTGTYG